MREANDYSLGEMRDVIDRIVCRERTERVRLQVKAEAATEPCVKCGGGGFSGYGTGYDDVCDECGGRGCHPVELKEHVSE